MGKNLVEKRRGERAIWPVCFPLDLRNDLVLASRASRSSR
jgi:hypothetical protein